MEREFRGKNLEEILKEIKRFFGEEEKRVEYSIIPEKTKMTGKDREIVVKAWVNHNENEKDIADFTQRFLELSGLELKFSVLSKEDFIEINFWGLDREILLSNNGELILALQYLYNKIFSKLNMRIFLECEGFRKRREQKIEKIAKNTVEYVEKTGLERILQPMAPWERRIVHLIVSKSKKVKSESIGDGFFKKVRIYSSE
ncbi:MAG: R3H domain-containing nucleic acid-binding protein [Candidatus Aminicenantia bacterium]